MLWSPSIDPAVLTLTAVPDFLSPALAAPLTGLEIHRDSPEGHYAVHNGGIATQLVLVPGSNPDGPVAVLIPLDAQTLGRIEALTRFWRASQGRPVPPDTRMTVQQRRRLRRMLQSFDGYRAGATQQDIAQVVFRIARLSRDDWQSSSERHAVKSLLRDARAMIAGGYRTLLHHRRQG